MNDAAALALALGLRAPSPSGRAPTPSTAGALAQAALRTREALAPLREKVRLKLGDEADVELALHAVDDACALVAALRDEARRANERPALVLARVLALLADGDTPAKSE